MILWYFFQNKSIFLQLKIDDSLTQAAENTIAILTNHPAPTVTSIEDGDETKNLLLKFALLFDRMDYTNKKLLIQHKQTINISQQKMVTLPIAPVPPVLPLITSPTSKTCKVFCLPVLSPKNMLLLFQPMGQFQNISYLCKKLLHELQGF